MPVRGSVPDGVAVPDASELVAVGEAVELVPDGSLLCTGTDADEGAGDEALGTVAEGWLV